MGFLTNMLKSGGSGDTGPKTQVQPAQQQPSGNVSPWNTMLGMSQAGGAAKSMLRAPENPPPGAPMGGQPGLTNPKAAAWDRYMTNTGATGDAVDPKDAALFSAIWD